MLEILIETQKRYKTAKKLYYIAEKFRRLKDFESACKVANQALTLYLDCKQSKKRYNRVIALLKLIEECQQHIILTLNN
ncbi:hypothetical protein BegalDRAFT_2242 [Beggiatoa alba B18LD]|uniref:Tetratricopeptide repeat protein n=1 Tax=Beggiatoa alba B18LD TaxID=395493 RepID=I3CHK3_9GAMM|nr:hypothetical protein BegalDRAFT_2242 [Beggiatoa alba B18LD]